MMTLAQRLSTVILIVNSPVLLVYCYSSNKITSSPHSRNCLRYQSAIITITKALHLNPQQGGAWTVNHTHMVTVQQFTLQGL